MTVKLILLKSGEFLISNIKELVSESDNQVYGYLLINPKKVEMSSPLFLKEDIDTESSVQVSLSSWILLSKDREFAIPKNWIVTVMEPVDRLMGMYEEFLND